MTGRFEIILVLALAALTIGMGVREVRYNNWLEANIPKGSLIVTDVVYSSKGSGRLVTTPQGKKYFYPSHSRQPIEIQ